MLSAARAKSHRVAPQHRGVYKFRGRIFGRSAYYALTSAGELLGGNLCVASDRETDAELVSRLFVELDRLDPVRPPLQLVKSAVRASIDGPSALHPEIAGLEWEGRVIPFRLPSDGSDATTRRVYESLYQMLYGALPSWPPLDELPELDRSQDQLQSTCGPG
jgi:hypothetical protein